MSGDGDTRLLTVQLTVTETSRDWEHTPDRTRREVKLDWAQLVLG